MDGALLQTAIIEAFRHRNTGFDEIVAFDERFCILKNIQVMYHAAQPATYVAYILTGSI